MKHILSILGLATLLFACADDYERSSGGDITSKSSVLNGLAQKEFFVEKPTEGSESTFLFRLSWTAPRLSYSNGLPAEVSNLRYTLEAGILGNSFEKSTVVAETDLLFFDVYSNQFFKIAEKLVGGDIEENVNIEFRVLASYDGAADPTISNTETAVLLYEVVKVEEPEPLEELTIRFKQTTGDWEAFAVYAYGDSEVYGGWPGLKLEEDANGWYSFVVPTNRPINLIINNNGGGSQFDFLTDPTSGGCYEFDTDASAFTAIDCPEEPVIVEKFTIRFKQATGDWESFAIYAWGDAEVYGGWPGLKLEADANDWYSFVVPTNRPINLIINNNNGGSQIDFLADPTAGGCYEFDTSTSTFTVVDCPELPLTIRWKYVGSEWTSTAIYAWGGEPEGDTFGGWPGIVGTPDEDGWCSVTVPAGQTVGNVIFNNGVGGEGGQFDLGVSVTENSCFEITSDSFTTVDCQ